MSTATAAQPKAISLSDPRSSISSTSTKGSAPNAKKHQVANICYPTGSKWDFLRPTTRPYQGFGSLANYAEMSGADVAVGTEESWTHDIHHKMETKDKAKTAKLSPYMSR